MRVLFPSHPFERKQIDPGFADEQKAAIACGFEVELFHHESLTDNNAAGAVRDVSRSAETQDLLFRGWMMPDEAYQCLYDALLERGRRLLASPAQYVATHYLPNAYPILQGHTPESAWIEGHDPEPVWALYQSFRDDDAIIKDYVKSAKHLWNEACFIPRGTDRATLDRMLRTFVNDRYKQFEKGIVLRRFIPLRTNGRDMRGHPVTEEFRLFFFGHQILIPIRPGFAPPEAYMQRVQAIADRIDSPFFSLDIAETNTGDHTIIEVGDGAVSGLPISILPEDFYAALARRWKEMGHG